MAQRRLVSLLVLAATAMACMPVQPTGSTTGAQGAPVATASPTPAASAPSVGRVAAPADLIADDDVAEADRQDLLSLFTSSDVQVYVPEDMISDGSGAYFSTEAAPTSRQSVRFRRRPPQPLSRQLRLAYAAGSRDRAIATLTIRQKVVWEVVTPSGTREVSGQVRQTRELQAVRLARRWRLDRVGAVRIGPDSDAPTLAITTLTLQADDQPLVTIQAGAAAHDVAALPTIRAGQRLTATITVAPPSSASSLLMGFLRVPGLGAAERLTLDADGTTLSRVFTVPNKPGIYHAGAEVVNLTALTQSPPQAVFANWAVTLRVQ